jgi:hypothetical protein
MNGTIFFSWQSDTSTSVCRNFIERALEIAADRIKADINVEEAVRENLEVDRDTKNVPGSPPIFETIKGKIAAASVFVPDLTFVGERADQTPVFNPNVLIEYGLALDKPGERQIIAVMNDAFGGPTEENIPFNLRHRRFPITYTLREDATEDERRAARKILVNRLESALREVFDSPEYKKSALSARPSSLDVAALYRKDLDYGDALASIRYGEGARNAADNVRALFTAIEAKCKEVNSTFELDIEVGWQVQPREAFQSCVLRKWPFGLDVTWEQHRVDSLEGAKLGIREFQGRVFVPGDSLAGVHVQQPKMLSEVFYVPTLSRQHELGWVKSMARKDEPGFLSTEDLADACVAQFLNLHRKESR